MVIIYGKYSKTYLLFQAYTLKKIKLTKIWRKKIFFVFIEYFYYEKLSKITFCLIFITIFIINFNNDIEKINISSI